MKNLILILAFCTAVLSPAFAAILHHTLNSQHLTYHLETNGSGHPTRITGSNNENANCVSMVRQTREGNSLNILVFDHYPCRKGESSHFSRAIALTKNIKTITLGPDDHIIWSRP